MGGPAERGGLAAHTLQHARPGASSAAAAAAAWPGLLTLHCCRQLNQKHKLKKPPHPACRCRGCGELQELRLNHNQLAALPPELAANKRLKILDLGGNPIASFDAVQVGAARAAARLGLLAAVSRELSLGSWQGRQ